MKARRISLLVLFCLAASLIPAQEKPTVSLGELIAALNESKDIADAAIGFRSRFPDDLSASDFASALSDLQRACEPILVLIVETDPPREHQRFAMNIAMGVKGVELAMWHYIYALLSGQPDRIAYADQLLNRGRIELSLADELSTEVR